MPYTPYGKILPCGLGMAITQQSDLNEVSQCWHEGYEGYGTRTSEPIELKVHPLNRERATR
jgi:hypothetical protein